MKTILIYLILFTGTDFINKPYQAKDLGGCDVSAINLIQEVATRYEDINGFFTKDEHYQVIAYACHEEA